MDMDICEATRIVDIQECLLCVRTRENRPGLAGLQNIWNFVLFSNVRQGCHSFIKSCVMIWSCPGHKKCCKDNAKLYVFETSCWCQMVALLRLLDVPFRLVSQKYEAYVYCPFPHQSQTLVFFACLIFLLCNGTDFLLSSETSEEHKCMATDLPSIDFLPLGLLL